MCMYRHQVHARTESRIQANKAFQKLVPWTNVKVATGYSEIYTTEQGCLAFILSVSENSCGLQAAHEYNYSHVPI